MGGHQFQSAIDQLRSSFSFPNLSEGWLCNDVTSPTGWAGLEPVYRTPFFAVLCLSAALLIGRLLYVQRFQRVAAQAREDGQRWLGERERCARELQDRLLQGLQGLTLNFQIVADQTSPDDKTYALINDALSKADAMLVDGRERARVLRFGEADLPQMLEWLADDTHFDENTKIKVLVANPPRELRLGVSQGLAEIAREAVGNARRHADAGRIRVLLIYAPRQLRLVVEDDGRGLDQGVLGRTPGGVDRMHERASGLQGTLSIQSRPGSGTTLSVVVPAQYAYTRRPV